MKTLSIGATILVCLGILSCAGPTSSSPTPPLASTKTLSTFSFASPAATGLITGTNIAITVPSGTAVTALVATFASSGVSVKVGSTTQTSGTTPNDFTSPVTYSVSAADGSVQNYTVTVTLAAPYGMAQWAQSLTAGTNGAFFYGAACDGSGNGYSVGYLIGNQTFGFGNGITATGTVSSNYNPVLVKYNSSGTAQWARTLAAGTDQSYFNAVTIDSSGNTYAVGYINGTGAYNFGNGSVSGTSSSQNPVIVKYDSSGSAQWAATMTGGTAQQVAFTGVGVDSSSNTYAVANIFGTGTVAFAAGVTASGFANVSTPVIVKYSSLGAAQWASALTAVPASAYFYGVTSDGSGNTYAVGFIRVGTFNFGNGVTATGTTSNSNTVIVKYSSSGTAQWAQTLTAGATGAYFNGVTIDSSGSLYAVGSVTGTSAYGFGNGVSVTGTGSGSNAVIVKYNGSGAAQWAQTLTAGTSGAYFNGATIDSSGSIYAVGSTTGTDTYGFGNGVSVTGTGSGTKTNTVMVKYSSSGSAQWAQTLTSGTNGASLNAVASDGSGNIFAVGSNTGTGAFGFGNSVTATGTGGTNALIVKYASR